MFADSTLKQALTSNSLDLPSSSTISGISSKIEYHIVGDDAFPLTMRIMKPYPHRNLVKEKRIYNYRLSRARKVVENAFGILAHRWRVFLTKIKLSPDKVTNVILAACCLHNFMVEKNKAGYAAAADLENSDHSVSRGSWRSDAALTILQPTPSHNASRNAKLQRDLLANYFNDCGSVPWQDNMVI